MNKINQDDYFEILNTTLSGKPIFEGVAKIIKVLSIDEGFNQARCEVQFYGENETYIRFVNLDKKCNPSVTW